MRRISLFGRKRTKDLGGDHDETESKKDELLALKLNEINQEASATGSLQMLPLERINPDPNQPRKQFRNIDTLANSIREKGIIQPIIVTPKNDNGSYTVIAGERRFRAAKQAGLSSIPSIIRDETDANVVILQLLENDQRENVSPLEESDSLLRLIGEMDLSKAQVAKELGRDSSWVSIRLGLQKASPEIKALVSDGIIEDVRTLHELRKFEEESPEKARQLIHRFRNNNVTGSYRQIIAGIRKQKGKRRATQVRSSTVQSIQHVDGYLELDIGAARPVRYKIESAVLDTFLQKVIQNKVKNGKQTLCVEEEL